MNIRDAIFAVVDVETTGLDPIEDRVVELAVVGASLAHGVAGIWTTLVNPGRPIPAEASAIHHIVAEDVENSPSFDEVMATQKYDPESIVMVAHNAAFDSQFVPAPTPWICTMRLAQKLWPDLEHLGNQYLRYHLKLECPEVKGLAAHRADADAIVTAHLLIFELEEVLRRAKAPDEATIESLVKWINEPSLLRTCRFGKHKGTAWSEVPRDYLQWMISPRGMTDMDVDTRHTAEHYLRAK